MTQRRPAQPPKRPPLSASPEAAHPEWFTPPAFVTVDEGYAGNVLTDTRLDTRTAIPSAALSAAAALFVDLVFWQRWIRVRSAFHSETIPAGVSALAVYPKLVLQRGLGVKKLRRRITMFRECKWDELLLEARRKAASSAREDRQTANSALSTDRARRMVAGGRVSTLLSSLGPAPSSPPTRVVDSQLRSKCPGPRPGEDVGQRRSLGHVGDWVHDLRADLREPPTSSSSPASAPQLPPPPPWDHPWSTQCFCSPEEGRTGLGWVWERGIRVTRSAVTHQSRLAAPGPTGLRPAHLLDMSAVRGSNIRVAISMVVDSICVGAAEAWLAASLISPLPKPDGGVRPIGLGEVLARTAGHIVNDKLTKALRQSLKDGGQYGIEPSGAAHVHDIIERHAAAGRHVLQMDIENAFNSIDRSRILRFIDSIRDRRGAATARPYLDFQYRSPPPTWVVRGRGARPSALAESPPLHGARGVVQGECAASTLFAATILEIAGDATDDATVPECSTPETVWLADDGFVVAEDLADLWRYYEAFVRRAAEHGMALKPAKCKLIVGRGEDGGAHPEISRVDMMSVVGGPVAAGRLSEETRTELHDQALMEHAQEVAALVRSFATKLHDPQVVLWALQKGGSFSRVQSRMALSIRYPAEALALLDAASWDALCRGVFRRDPATLSETERALAWTRASLPVRSGGLSVHSTSEWIELSYFDVGMRADGASRHAVRVAKLKARTEQVEATLAALNTSISPMSRARMEEAGTKGTSSWAQRAPSVAEGTLCVESDVVSHALSLRCGLAPVSAPPATPCICMHRIQIGEDAQHLEVCRHFWKARHDDARDALYRPLHAALTPGHSTASLELEQGVAGLEGAQPEDDGTRDGDLVFRDGGVTDFYDVTVATPTDVIGGATPARPSRISRAARAATRKRGSEGARRVAATGAGYHPLAFSSLGAMATRSWGSLKDLGKRVQKASPFDVPWGGVTLQVRARQAVQLSLMWSLGRALRRVLRATPRGERAPLPPPEGPDSRAAHAVGRLESLGRWYPFDLARELSRDGRPPVLCLDASSERVDAVDLHLGPAVPLPRDLDLPPHGATPRSPPQPSCTSAAPSPPAAAPHHRGQATSASRPPASAARDVSPESVDVQPAGDRQPRPLCTVSRWAVPLIKAARLLHLEREVVFPPDLLTEFTGYAPPSEWDWARGATLLTLAQGVRNSCVRRGLVQNLMAAVRSNGYVTPRVQESLLCLDDPGDDRDLQLVVHYIGWAASRRVDCPRRAAPVISSSRAPWPTGDLQGLYGPAVALVFAVLRRRRVRITRRWPSTVYEAAASVHRFYRRAGVPGCGMWHTIVASADALVARDVRTRLASWHNAALALAQRILDASDLPWSSWARDPDVMAYFGDLLAPDIPNGSARAGVAHFIHANRPLLADDPRDVGCTCYSAPRRYSRSTRYAAALSIPPPATPSPASPGGVPPVAAAALPLPTQHDSDAGEDEFLPHRHDHRSDGAPGRSARSRRSTSFRGGAVGGTSRVSSFRSSPARASRSAHAGGSTPSLSGTSSRDSPSGSTSPDGDLSTSSSDASTETSVQSQGTSSGPSSSGSESSWSSSRTSTASSGPGSDTSSSTDESGWTD